MMSADQIIDMGTGAGMQGGEVVFQGTPEELGNFDHPFNDEVIHSLEGLQKELTGLYSKRQFKMLNHVQLKRRESGESYCVAVFTLSDMDAIIAILGHDAAQEVIHSMGMYIDKHFGAIGGFSTRRKSNEFVTMLPFSDLAEARSILTDFVNDFHEQGISDIWVAAQKLAPSDKCVDFAILAGIAEGQPVAEIDSVIELAKSQQKEIGRLRCAAKE
jgi:phospholipid/cholesterol/gamma-HCH transport system ATP-binding protein